MRFYLYVGILFVIFKRKLICLIGFFVYKYVFLFLVNFVFGSVFKVFIIYDDLIGNVFEFFYKFYING